MKSLPGEFNATDFVKTLQAFIFNVISVASALGLAIVALPADQIPSWLIWLVPLSGVLNAVYYGLKRWRDDNRSY